MVFPHSGGHQKGCLCSTAVFGKFQLSHGGSWQVQLPYHPKVVIRLSFRLGLCHPLSNQLLYSSISITDRSGRYWEGGCHLQVLECISLSSGPSGGIATWSKVKPCYKRLWQITDKGSPSLFWLVRWYTQPHLFWQQGKWHMYLLSWPPVPHLVMTAWGDDMVAWGWCLGDSSLVAPKPHTMFLVVKGNIFFHLPPIIGGHFLPKDGDSGFMADFVFLPSIEGSWHKQSSGELVVAACLDRITCLEGRHSCQGFLGGGHSIFWLQ